MRALSRPARALCCSIRGKILAACGFAILIALAQVILVSVASKQQLTHTTDLNEYYQILAHTHNVRSELNAMQTGYRGFLLSGEDQFLEPYLRARTQLSEHLNYLLHISETDTAAAQWRELIGQIERWQQSVMRPGIAMRRTYPAGVQSWLTSGVGAEHMERIHTRLENIVDGLNREIEMLGHQRSLLGELDSEMISLVVGLGALLSMLVAYLLSNDTAARLIRIATHTERLRNGEFRIGAPADRGNDEITQVAKSLGELHEALETINLKTRALSVGELRNPILDRAVPGELGKHYENMIAKLRGTSEALDLLANGNLDVDVTPDTDADLLGEVTSDLINSLKDKHYSLSSREAEREAIVHTQEFEARLRKALDMAQQEKDVMAVVSAVADFAGLDEGVEVLMADNSRAHVNAAINTHTIHGCAVPTPGACAAIRSGQLQTFSSSNDFDACPYFRQRGGENELSAACVPLNIMGQASGVLHAVSLTDWVRRPEKLEMVSVIGARLGERLSVVRAFARSQAQAATDPLTGLLNRRSLGEELRILVASGQPYTISYGDLDNFKKLNDTHGHDAGDRALRLFAKVIRETLRPGDLVGRWGGEEFVAVLPASGVDATVSALERVRAKLAEALESGTCPAYTVSFGVAASEGGDPMDGILTKADSALLEAKRAGRNRTIVAQETLDTNSHTEVELAPDESNSTEVQTDVVSLMADTA